MTHLRHWIIDYVHLLRGQANSYLYRKEPKHYLGYQIKGKNPVVILPGIAEKWAFLKPIADKISLAGHPVYIIPKLGYNFTDIPKSAAIVKEVIETNKLEKVILVAHSKGGLIGKYLMVQDKDKKISGMVAISTPFSGSALAKFIPHKIVKELSTDGQTVNVLKAHKGINSHIVSIFPVYDNHVWHKQKSNLERAKNIEVNVHGHHRVLFSKDVRKKVLEEISSLSNSGK